MVFKRMLWTISAPMFVDPYSCGGWVTIGRVALGGTGYKSCQQRNEGVSCYSVVVIHISRRSNNRLCGNSCALLRG